MVSGIDVGQEINEGSVKFGKKNKKNMQAYVEKKIKLENIRSPWKKYQNLINVGPLISE